MNVHDKLSLALIRTGHSPLAKNESYHLVGSGAWHDAYLVRTDAEDPLVVRLRKNIIYGRKEKWDEQLLHEDYAPVGMYYAVANRCWSNICPAVYHYRIDPDLIFSMESYIPGSPLLLGLPSKQIAVEAGKSIGNFIKAMHAVSPPLSGHGLVTWKEAEVVATSQDSWPRLWEARYEKMRYQLATLAGASIDFDRDRVQRKLDEALNLRCHSSEPIVLANRDISPENLLVRANKWIGLVDPVPILENGTYSAAWFMHCYRLFLPSLNNAPRYAHHHFNEHAGTLAAVAEGFEAGYAQGDRALKLALRLDEFFWTLDLAFESYELLKNNMTPELRMRRGNKTNVKATLFRSVGAMEESAW